MMMNKMVENVFWSIKKHKSEEDHHMNSNNKKINDWVPKCDSSAI